jgi:hypothetical protein
LQSDANVVNNTKLGTYIALGPSTVVTPAPDNRYKGASDSSYVIGNNLVTNDYINCNYVEMECKALGVLDKVIISLVGNSNRSGFCIYAVRMIE